MVTTADGAVSGAGARLRPRTHRSRSARERPLRLRPLVPAVAAAIAALVGLYGAVLYPWLLNWGATPAEQRMVLPGDDLLPATQRYFTRAITVQAPRDVVWRWITQIGQDRAGFYSNDYLENLAGGDIHNADDLRPEWQQRAAGDRVPMARPDIAWGAVGGALYLPIEAVEPGRMITRLPGRFVLLDDASGATRLLLREPLDESAFVRWVYAPMHFVMEQRMLRGIKERAEGRPLVPAVVVVMARAGWGLAAACVAGLFLSRRRWAPWGVLCAVLMVPSFTSTGDLGGALAGFLALGITALGALRWGRRMLAIYPLVAAVVLLILLAVPDSYSAFGLLFLAVTATLAASATVKAARAARTGVPSVRQFTAAGAALRLERR